ncbi:MAG: PAS domain-containing protein [Bacteroidales bacterium]|nr:PAS domain-containing protein [Bacteroidales bacterium]
MEKFDYFKEAPIAVTVCDKDGKVLEMNDKSVSTFIKDGKSLIGKSLLDCHPEPARTKLLGLLENHNVNAYTISKNGIKKLIYQMPWFAEGEFAGYIELSMQIPEEMPHFVRK